MNVQRETDLVGAIQWLVRLLLLPALWTGATCGMAAPVNVVNAGFEDISGESPFNEFTFGPLNGWNLYDPGGITGGGAGATYYIGTLTPFESDPVGNPGVYANFPDGAPEGQRLGIAFNFEGSGGEGVYGFVQTLAATLQPNTRYRLQVEIANIGSATAMNGQFFDLVGFPGYRVDLLAGGVVVAQDGNTLEGAIDDGEISTSTFHLSTGATHPRLGQTLGIRLVNLNEVDPLFTDSDLEVDFDDVRLDAAAALAGDYNDNGTIDAADYAVWRKNVGAPAGTLPHDIDGGLIGIAQYATWRGNFGVSLPPGAGSAVVPEPRAVRLCVWALGVALGWRRARSAARCG